MDLYKVWRVTRRLDQAPYPNHQENSLFGFIISVNGRGFVLRHIYFIIDSLVLLCACFIIIITNTIFLFYVHVYSSIVNPPLYPLLVYKKQFIFLFLCIFQFSIVNPPLYPFSYRNFIGG